jgi:hypothetical protein
MFEMLLETRVGLRVKHLLLLLDFNENWNCQTTFNESLPYGIKKKTNITNGLGTATNWQTVRPADMTSK